MSSEVKKWLIAIAAIFFVPFAVLVIYSIASPSHVKIEDVDFKQTSSQTSNSATVPKMSESDQIEALAKKTLGKINSFSLIDECVIEGAPVGSKTVNVISAAGYKGGFITAAGDFLFDVFNRFPDVYLVQMKGEQDDRPLVQFSMCRADIGGLQASDWYSNYINCSRDYWDEEQ